MKQGTKQLNYSFPFDRSIRYLYLDLMRVFPNVTFRLMFYIGQFLN